MDFYCSGSLSRSMGCAGISASSGYESAYFNPSLIPAKKSFGVGFLYASQDVDVSLGGKKLAEIGNPLDPVRHINIGASLTLSDLPFVKKGAVSDNIGFGVAGLLPASRVVMRVTTAQTRVPSTLLYGNRNTRFSLFIGGGGKIPLRMGGGFFNIYLGAGVYALADLPMVIDANLSPDKDLLVIDAALELGPAPVLGTAFEFVSEGESLRVRLGGMYRGGSEVGIPLSANAYLMGDKILSLTSALFFVYTPPAFGGGLFASVKAGGSVKISLGADAVIMQFSDFKFPLIEVEKIEPKEVGEALPISEIQKPSLEDVLVLRGGISADISDIIGKTDFILGAGFYSFPSPLKSPQKNTFFVDGDRIGITGGLGVRFPSEFLVEGEIEVIFSGGVQMVSEASLKSDYGEAKISASLPFFSVSLNLNY